MTLRRLLRDVSSVLIISGLLLLLDAGVTLVWQEPVSAVIALVERAQIDRHWLSYRSAPLSSLERRIVASITTERARQLEAKGLERLAGSPELEALRSAA